MLILFDIDATLITTGGVGVLAMGDAGRELFGAGFDETRIQYAGRLDPLILEDLLRDNGLDTGAANLGAMRDGYRRHLAARLSSAPARALPGVMDLLGALAGRRDVTLGLLTGNFADTGAMKLRACGIDPAGFEVAVWGNESPLSPPRREHLPPVGIDRFRERRGRDPRRTVIVGDTPHDVRCALENGCECLAVATGSFTAGVLRETGAQRVVSDLSSTREIVEFLVGPGGVGEARH